MHVETRQSSLSGRDAVGLVESPEKQGSCPSAGAQIESATWHSMECQDVRDTDKSMVKATYDGEVVSRA